MSILLHYEMVVISGMTNITSDLDPEIWSSDLVVETSRPQMETLDPVMVMTSHAMLMIFFFIMPGVMSGLGNLLVPIQLCVPELVFPKVNNLGTLVLWIPCLDVHDVSGSRIPSGHDLGSCHPLLHTIARARDTRQL